MPQKTPFNRNVSFSRAKNLPSIATGIFDEEKHALQSKWQFLPARFFLSNRSEAPSRYNRIIRISVVQLMNSRAWWPSRCSHGSGDNLRSLVTIYVLYSFYCFIRISAVQPMNSHAWWPSRCSHASGDNPHTLCTNITLNITLDRIDAMSITTVLVRGKRRHMGRSFLIA